MKVYWRKGKMRMEKENFVFKITGEEGLEML